jgi:hypothetical protein
MSRLTMMRLFLTAGLAWSPSIALSQSTDAAHAIDVIGSAPQVCSLQRPNLANNVGTTVNFTAVTGNLLQIQTLVDPATLAANAASVSVSFDAFCNFPHRLSVESENNGLWQTDGSMNQPADGFAYALPYEAEVSWADVRGKLEANANVRRIVEQRLDVGQAAAGEVQLSIRIQPGASNTRVNAPVLAGFYGDTIRVFLEPR